ncbi:MAG: alginate lyase family protein [Magnetococcales bacterium]|nr:alginate lyase family protein [Magnetococcales bacterium]
MMHPLGWYWRRLQAMTLAEMGHRLQEMIVRWAGHYRLLPGSHPPPPRKTRTPAWLQISQAVDPTGLLTAATRTLEGTFPLLGLAQAGVGPEPAWNVDPRLHAAAVWHADAHWPDEKPTQTPTQPKTPHKDIKYVWELNRHVQWLPVAQAWSLTRNPLWLEGFRRQLQGWLDQCPPGRGPNWQSPLEAGIRLINWSAVWHLLGGWEAPLFAGAAGERLRQAWLAAIHAHMHFIRWRFSAHSSANNHLVGEAAGLWIATCTWPCWPQVGRWQKLSHKILERECLLQNGADGVNREQAIHYHLFTGAFLLLAGMAGKIIGQEFSAAYHQRLADMVDHVVAVMDAGGHLPEYGDADDGLVLRLDPQGEASPVREFLRLAAGLLQRPARCAKQPEIMPTHHLARHQKPDVKQTGTMATHDPTGIRIQDPTGIRTQDPTGIRTQDPTGIRTQDPEPIRRFFAEAGHAVLGRDFATEREIRLFLDAGPLGYLAIAAHGHADALALHLSIGGFPFLVDPGTGSYHRPGPWRNWFRGTAAHNTVRLDDQEQSVSGGPFLWQRQARALCEVWEEDAHRQHWVGSHDGYQRLADPVLHRRHVTFRKAEGSLTIIDHLHGSGTHHVEQHWHFHPKCRVFLHEDGTIRAERNGSALELRGDAAASPPLLLRGQQNPPAGWYSPGYDRLVPTTTVQFRCIMHGPLELSTSILCLPAKAINGTDPVQHAQSS